MQRNDRRKFLANLGSGMLVGSLGTALAFDLGISSAYADETDDRLTFGDMEPLVALMQETPLDRLLTVLNEKINGGTDLSTLIAAGSLANARTFGGHDYVGFHTFMALTPALQMAAELPTERRALPVLKVLYRNTDRIQQFGGSSNELLRRIDASKHDGVRLSGEALQAATRQADFEGAEQIMAALANESPAKIFNRVQYPVQDEADVHRVVLAWRAWLAIDLVGQQHANTLLRQSVRYCLRNLGKHCRSRPTYCCCTTPVDPKIKMVTKSKGLFTARRSEFMHRTPRTLGETSLASVIIAIPLPVFWLARTTPRDKAHK